MSNHPINLTVRFWLEIAALVAAGNWGWQMGDGWVRYALAAGIPLILATLWGTFRVPNDPGSAPVPIPGTLRLAFELGYFAFAAWALYDAQLTSWAWAFGGITALHYLVSYDRVRWLIGQ